jgi:cytoskeletal protein CcmA (bactofilin family)
MGGKAALIFVLGFSFLMGYTVLNLNTAGTRAVSNMSTYNAMTASHNLALAGANVGLAKFYRDTTWGSTGTESVTQTFDTGPLTGQFTASAFKVPQGKMMRSVSRYAVNGSTYRDTVEVILSTETSNSFSLFAWMTNLENGVFWITGDSVWGRVHSNDNLTVSGSPVFLAKVTTAKGFIPPLGKSKSIGGKVYTNKAIFKNPPQPETGVARIDFPMDLTGLASAAVTGGRKYTGDIWVTLDGKNPTVNGDGKAYIRATKTGPIVDSIALSDAGFNGVIQGTGRVNVEGKLDGKLTIASYSTPLGLTNDVYIQGDILYEQNPRYGPSDDVLGLVANHNVLVADNVPVGGNREIHASIFARTGSFGAENYSGRPIQGELRVLGSIVQNIRGPVGTFSGASTLNHGFYKRYRYDERLSDLGFRPPSYPGFLRKTYAILNWWESYRVMDFQ